MVVLSRTLEDQWSGPHVAPHGPEGVRGQTSERRSEESGEGVRGTGVDPERLERQQLVAEALMVLML